MIMLSHGAGAGAGAFSAGLEHMLGVRGLECRPVQYNVLQSWQIK